MKTIAVDFDGVIHQYSRGWQDGTIYDPPLPGALEALATLMETYAVFIHTTRDPGAVAGWLAERGFDNLDKFLDKTLFQRPVAPDLKQRMVAEFEKIKAGY